MPKPEPTKSSNDKVTEKDVPLTKEERRAKKRELEKQPVAWVDIEDDKNTNVYVSGLPSTITEEQFTVSIIIKPLYTNFLSIKNMHFIRLNRMYLLLYERFNVLFSSICFWNILLDTVDFRNL